MAGSRLRDKKCVLFDLDGTLVDSSPLHDRAFREVLGREAPELLEGFRYAVIAGLTTPDGWRRLGLGAEPERLVRLVRDKREAYRRLLADGGPDAMAGAARLLASLRERGLQCHVVTSATREGALRTLERTGLRAGIASVIAAEDVAHGKPHPEPYVTALRRTGLAAGAVLVVEDADSGIDAAIAARLDVVRVHVDGPDRVPCFSSLDALRAALEGAEPRAPGPLVAIVPAAGRGSRLGLDVPKIFADLGSAVVWDVLAARLARVVRHAHLVLSPQGAAWLDQHPRTPPSGLTVTSSVQSEPVGMGDAVLGALSCLPEASQALIVWGDQLGVSASTLERVARVACSAAAPSITIPLLKTSSPYVDYRFDDAGRLLQVNQAREGESCAAEGLADVGVFALSLRGLGDSWNRYLRQGDRRGARTGELNFLPFLAWLSHEGRSVHRVEVTNPDEARGLNTPEDLAFFRARQA